KISYRGTDMKTILDRFYANDFPYLRSLSYQLIPRRGYYRTFHISADIDLHGGRYMHVTAVTITGTDIISRIRGTAYGPPGRKVLQPRFTLNYEDDHIDFHIPRIYPDTGEVIWWMDVKDLLTA